MKRFLLEKDPMECLVHMSEGNPGAATVLALLYHESGDMGWTYVAWLDDLEIYGSRIWLAYKDVCHEDVGMLRERLRHGRAELKREVDTCVGGFHGDN